NGSIEVVATEEATRTGEVSLVAEIRHGLRRTGHRAEVEGTVLVVRASCPFLSQWCDADYRLEIPEHLAVQASLDNGHLTIIDVDGPVDANNDNGPVDLIRLSGDVRASTDNGHVAGVGLES